MKINFENQIIENKENDFEKMIEDYDYSIVDLNKLKEFRKLLFKNKNNKNHYVSLLKEKINNQTIPILNKIYVENLIGYDNFPMYPVYRFRDFTKISLAKTIYDDGEVKFIQTKVWNNDAKLIDELIYLNEYVNGGLIHEQINGDEERYDSIFYDIFSRSKKLSEIIPKSSFIKENENFINQLFSQRMEWYLSETYGIRFQFLSLEEIASFFYYLCIQKVEKENTLKSFTQKFGTTGFRTFLSLEQAGLDAKDKNLTEDEKIKKQKEMGDKILVLGDKLEAKSAEALFEKYAEIIDEVDNVAEYLKNSIGEKATPEIINNTKEQLLIKGKNLLEFYADKASVCKEDECIDISRELVTKMEDIKSSLMLFASVCKELSQRGELTLEDLQGVELDITNEVDGETKTEAKKIFKENRQNYSKELLEVVEKDFNENIDNPKPNQRYFFLRVKGELASYMRLDENEDGSVYGASFNVRPELRGSAIGTELLKKIIEMESKTRAFKAICYEKNPMLARYTGDFGFEIVGEIDNYHGTGEKFYELLRKPKITAPDNLPI